MGTIRLFKVWLLITLMVLSGGSLAYAQFSDCGGNTCTNDSVGIGTTSPGDVLHIVDSGGGSGGIIRMDSSAINNRAVGLKIDSQFGGVVQNWRIGHILDNTGNFAFIEGPNERVTIQKGGNVGIGTTSPSDVLHIVDSGGGGGGIIRMDSSAINNRAVGLKIDSQFGGVVQNWRIGHILDNTGNFAFIEGPNERVTIQKGGNVGIGTTSPTSKLHVAGNGKITGDLTVDGNIGAKYQDVAEWVRSPAPLAPGTVVVIDPAESNRVLPSSQSYDTRIAGVVSSQPGIILGEAGDDKTKVAHSGRVKVKAEAQSGPIGIGDLLVSSSTPGHAMVSKPVEVSGVAMHRPGTIVGKALEPLREGQGEILVFLTLQ